MFGLVLLLIGIVVLVVLSVGMIMFFDLTLGSGERVVAAREQTERQWRPPYARGAELMSWARSMAARSVKNALLDGPDAATAKKIVGELNEGVSRAMLPLASRLDATRSVPCPDAGQGITGVSAPEAIELADYLRHALSTSEVQRIRELSEANAHQIALNRRPGGMGAPCSLQGEDCVCKAYSARPFGCRPLHAAVIAHELGLDSERGEDGSPTWAAHTDAIARGIAEGLTRGLEAAGIDAKIYELHSALVAALDSPDAAERWAAGEDVFAGCRLHKPGPNNGLSLVL